ncbi:MAG TPA: GEVED domain-containing protein, partial [Ferruginibacter sp.]|nr:GEVED domain-containing protein [Ferruginibacter sp.]
MMQRFSLLLFGVLCLQLGTLRAQVYVNGNLSTGSTSNSGSAAPAGYTWSECQNDAGNTTESNTNAGFGASITNGFALADDFTVPAGPNWAITKFTFYGYQTGYTGATSPFTELRFQIHNGNPSAGPTTIVFGDLTTNRLTASNEAFMYRIFNSAVPAPGTAVGTTRKIWTIEADVNISLPAGTYWIEWQTDVTGGAGHFLPPSTVAGVRTVAGYNAQQHTLAGNTWAAVIDAGNPASAPDVALDMPFRINYSTSACTGTPDPGNTLSTASTVCPTTSFSLSLSNTINGSGITYQWQSSPDNTTWTDISGATGTTYTTNQTVSTYYRCKVTCATGGTGFSNPVQVLATPPSGCYCTSSATSTADEDIFNVTIGTLNNTSTCTSLAPGPGSVLNRYSNYTSGTGAPAPGQIVSNGDNPFSISVGTCGGNFSNNVAVFIDLNQDGQFSANEKLYTSTTLVGPNTRTGNIFIPNTALSGLTLMRVVCVETTNAGGINACGTYTWGETEDYFVTITPCTPATMGTQPTSQTLTCGGTATFTASVNGSNPTYQWQQKLPSAITWTDVVNNSMFSGATTNTLTITGATSAMNGYQYRLQYKGGCSSNDWSNAATLTVNPIVGTVNPTSATICNGSSQQIAITNSASASTTVTFNSGNIALPIPDDDDNGISNVIAVSGIPANAVVSSIDVKFNATHTWVGDLDINLVAPNGTAMNLIGALDGGTGSNSTDNFTNTVISSTGTTAISGAAAPRTGTFAAERRATYGPTPYVQVGAVNWSNLQSVLNGNWRLAIADFAAGDDGILANWEISITYTSPQLATGVWAPLTDIYTDAGLTTPYTGGSVNTVYVNPTTSTTYSVIVSTQICTSNPVNIPITVANPITNLVSADDASVCANDNTSFTVSADGNPIVYQ